MLTLPVLRLNWREPLFEGAGNSSSLDTKERVLSVTKLTSWCAAIAKSHFAKAGDVTLEIAIALTTTVLGVIADCDRYGAFCHAPLEADKADTTLRSLLSGLFFPPSERGVTHLFGCVRQSKMSRRNKRPWSPAMC